MCVCVLECVCVCVCVCVRVGLCVCEGVEEGGGSKWKREMMNE